MGTAVAQVQGSLGAPPYAKDSSLIADPDLVLPAVYSYDTLGFGLVADDMRPFLRTSFDLTKLDRIHSFLWLAGFPRLPRSLHTQKLLRRDIVLVEEMDLHLVWSKARIFIKPLPDFLLNYEFWQSHIGKSEELRRAACGLLYSYFGLIRYDHDLWIAQEAHLINPNITFREWTAFVRIVFRDWGAGDTLSLDKRFHYGELHLERLHWIYRFSPQTISLSTIVAGYPQAAEEAYVPFMERYNNVVSAFGIIIVILTAMQVGLGTESLQSNQAFQRASFGFTAFAIIVSTCLTGFFLLMPTFTSIIFPLAAILGRSSQLPKMN